MQTFLDVPPEAIGSFNGGKARPSSRPEIAVMRSLVSKGKLKPVMQNYGQVIGDECHNTAAASFEAILHQMKASDVLKLSATLVRRNSLQPILLMK